MLHKVVIFYVLAFVFTIILAGIQEGASISPEAVILPQWGSGLAALVMLVIFRGDRHWFSVVDRSIPLSRYVVAALVPLGGALAAYLINTLILGAIQATAFNVMLAGVFHLMINITNLFSYSIINEISFIVVNALVWAAIAVAIVLTRRPLFIPAGLAWTVRKE
jgi:hypothetical protein